MPSAQRGPARSNIAVGARGYIKRAKANSVFSAASEGTGKSLYSMAGYSRNWRWNAKSDPTSSGRAPANSQRVLRMSSIKEPPRLLAYINRKRAAKHGSHELRFTQIASGVADQ